jgi:hypothetical protein
MIRLHVSAAFFDKLALGNGGKVIEPLLQLLSCNPPGILRL